ncbi:unnamed protein product [Enterobius vermicularis]|uniref:ANF_receptor domain-containing protein n=1 Tax=Enterobius vermicularis TaxID=51028 RepID=A0A158Q950_ENTVE|nr:unnamed protein product [Enterobius vermicularis]
MPSFDSHTKFSLAKAALEIKVGISMPMDESIMGITFLNTVPAAEIALDKARAQGMAPNVTFTLFYRGTTCTGLEGTTSTLELINVDKVDVIFGPMCNSAALITGPALVYFDKPSFLWGPSPTSDYDDSDNYPLSSTSVPNTYGFAMRSRAVLSILDRFGWRDIAFVYTTSKTDVDCIYFAQEIEAAIADVQSQVTLVLKSRLDEASFNQTLDAIRVRSRIVITCFDTPADTRNFIVNAYAKGMINEEYVYITADLRRFSGGQWNSENEDIINKAMSYFLIIATISEEYTDNAHQQFQTDFLLRVQQAPFNCSNCTEISPFAYFLYDAATYFMTLLDKNLQKSTDGYKSGTQIMESCSYTGTGLTGEIIMTTNCTRQPTFFLKGNDINGDEVLFATIKIELPNVVRTQFILLFGFRLLYLSRISYKAPGIPDFNTFIPHYNDEATAMWATRGGVRPLNEPICGFENTRCVSYAIWYGTGGGAFGLVIIIAVLIVACTWRRITDGSSMKLMIQDEADGETRTNETVASRIPKFDRARREIAPNIRKCSDTVNFQKKKAESHRSLQSGFESNTSTTVDVNLRTSGYTPYLYHNELVLAKQHSPLHRLTKSHIRFMTQNYPTTHR